MFIFKGCEAKKRNLHIFLVTPHPPDDSKMMTRQHIQNRIFLFNGMIRLVNFKVIQLMK